MNGDAIDEDEEDVDAEAGDDVPVHVVLVGDEVLHSFENRTLIFNISYRKKSYK